MSALIELYLTVFMVCMLSVITGLCAGYYLCMSKRTIYERYRRKIRNGFKD